MPLEVKQLNAYIFSDNLLLLINIFGHILVFMKRTCLNEKIMQDVLGVKTSFYVQ